MTAHRAEVPAGSRRSFAPCRRRSLPRRAVRGARGRLGYLAVMALLLPAVAAAAESERFSFTADRMETVLAEGRERTLLTGSVTLVADDFEITADRIELYGEELNFALSEGGVRVVQPEHGIELVSESLLFDRQNRVVRIQGDALLIDHDNEMVIKGGFLEHWERRDETLIQIGVRILSEDLVARAQFVRYDRGEQTVTLSGLPVVTWQGDEYRAARIFIDLDEDRIVLDGSVSGQIETAAEEEDEPEAPAEPTGEAAGPDPTVPPEDVGVPLESATAPGDAGTAPGDAGTAPPAGGPAAAPGAAP
jgi:lipopolysaccharide export system protein LptA